MLTDEQLAGKWETWYAHQEVDHCRRCGKEFPNDPVGDGYCSKWCRWGFPASYAEGD